MTPHITNYPQRAIHRDAYLLWVSRFVGSSDRRRNLLIREEKVPRQRQMKLRIELPD